MQIVGPITLDRLAKIN